MKLMSDTKTINKIVQSMDGDIDSVFTIPRKAVPHRIVFSTPTVGPAHLPPFVYTSTKIGFDFIAYTAIVHAETVEAAIERVKHSWPDSVITFVQPGVDDFFKIDHMINPVMYGAAATTKKRRLSLFGALFGIL